MKTAGTNLDTINGNDALINVRRRGVFLLSLLFWASAAGFLVFLSGYLVVFLHYALAVAEKLRRVAGWQAPQQGTDWFLLCITAIIVLLPLLVIRLVWRNYMQVWRKRLAAVWIHPVARRAYSKTPTLSLTATATDRRKKTEYLRSLLGTSRWAPAWKTIRDREGPLFPSDLDPATISPGDYEKVAAGILRHIETDVSERAIATGLIVGISRNRFIDALTIISASLELQLHVLTLLGKKPSPRMWKELLKRTGASLFTNTYLNRDDAFIVSYTIKSFALGIGAMAELAQEGADVFAELDMDDALDTMSDTLSSGGTVTELLKGVVHLTGITIGTGLSIGAAGMKQISEIIEKAGDDMLQGILAGGVLYYHGMAVAAEVLALDQTHRDHDDMNRTFGQGVSKVTATAGDILRKHIRLRRDALRKKRKMAFESLKNSVKMKKPGAQ